MQRTLLGTVVCLAFVAGMTLAQPPSLQPPPGPVLGPELPTEVPGPVVEYAGAPPTVPEVVSEGPLVLPRCWLSGQYLLMQIKKGPMVPLVVTGPADDPFPGALDQPGTRILFGGSDLDFERFNGVKFEGGIWLNLCNTLGLEASGFSLQRRSITFSDQGDANGQPFLAQPFINARTGNENVYFISQRFADPNLNANMTGSVFSSCASSLSGWELNGVVNLARTRAFTVDVLVGVRQLKLQETVGYSVTSNNITRAGAVTFQGLTINPSDSVTHFDNFDTRNEYHGPQVGGRFNCRLFRLLTLELVGKVAVGTMSERVAINGVTTTTTPVGTILERMALNVNQATTTEALTVNQAKGGVYAQANNIGSHLRDRPFVMVPEVNFNLSVDLTTWLRAKVGYSLLYISEVVRPGDQIDRAVNPGVVPIDPEFGTPGGPPRPAFLFRGSDFWAQGFSGGLEFVF